MMQRLGFLMLFWMICFTAQAGFYEAHSPEEASLQRGAKLFMNYCSGCHSLQYLRYNRMGKDIGLVDFEGSLQTDLLKNNLIFTGAKITDPILTAMLPEDGIRWFGVAPPDLSLEAKVRGQDWIRAYLKGFYKAPYQPFGTNNAAYPETAMPNILVNLQGEQISAYAPGGSISHLRLLTQGEMSEHEFDLAVGDIVHFLAYASEPIKSERESLGYWVIGFLLILAFVLYWLKKAYWKHIR